MTDFNTHSDEVTGSVTTEQTNGADTAQNLELEKQVRGRITQVRKELSQWSREILPMVKSGIFPTINAGLIDRNG